MTRKLSISVPDHVYAYLDATPNASAEVVQAVEARIRVAKLNAFHAEHGIILTEEGRAWARARLAEGKARIAARQQAAAEQAQAWIGLIIDAEALIGYASLDLPTVLAVGELLRDVNEAGDMVVASALAYGQAFHTLPPDDSDAGRRLANLMVDVRGVVAVPFGGDDALRAASVIRKDLPDWHTAALAAGMRVQLATMDPARYAAAIDTIDVTETF